MRGGKSADGPAAQRRGVKCRSGTSCVSGRRQGEVVQVSDSGEDVSANRERVRGSELKGLYVQKKSLDQR